VYVYDVCVGVCPCGYVYEYEICVWVCWCLACVWMEKKRGEREREEKEGGSLPA